MVTLCAMLWSLPLIWAYYEAYIFPYWSSFLLPMVQIAIMSSMYCTIIMSWERYVRICLGQCIQNDVLKLWIRIQALRLINSSNRTVLKENIGTLHKHYWNSVVLNQDYISTLKVMQWLWTSISKQICNSSFKWGTKRWLWSRSCKDIRGQSWS